MLTISIDPIAFTIGSLAVRWYGIMVALAVISMIIVIPREAKRLGITQDLYGLFLWCILGGFVGSRLTFVLGDWERFVADPRSILGFGGQAQNGMVIGVIAAALIYMAVTKVRFSWLLRLGDAVALATPLALAIGRVGCTLNGCCFGKPSPFEFFPLAVVYTARPDLPAQYWNTPLYPTQIYHVLWNLITFLIVWRFRDRFKPPGSVFFFFLCLYAIGDLGIRFLRVGDTVVPGLQQAQLLNVIILAVFLPWLIILMRRHKASSEAELENQSP
jgi:phosphatidylglycerol---prolipoprotein diacylglyceryl transferase